MTVRSGASIRAHSGRCYSRAHYERNRDRYIAAAHVRQKRQRDLFVEKVVPRIVYERDNWTCHICRKPVLRAPRYKHDPEMASLDHLIPVSRGGEHSYANTACSHLRCNLAKGNRGGGEQLALVG